MPHRIQVKYHVKLGSRRTTVNMDRMLSDLLALDIGLKPDAPDAHATVCKWLQAELDEDNDPLHAHVSHWLRRQAIKRMISDDLAKAYAAWMEGKPA